MLVRLLYASRSSATEAEFTVILRQSRKHNAELGVTGLLCHSEGVFVQVLEGGRAPSTGSTTRSSPTRATAM
jgi:hypothetical protein